MKPKPKHPMDKEYLREMAKLVEAKLPDQHGFILLAFPFDGGEGQRVIYTSNANRADAINVLKEWLFMIGEDENWLKHIK